MIALDTSAALCLVERHEPSRSEITRWIASDDGRILISTLVVTECMVGPLRTRDQELMRSYEAFFAATETKLESVTPTIARRAARLRLTFDLKAVDAIHLATAIEHHVPFLTTDARDFQRCVGRIASTVIVIPRIPQP